MCVCACAHVHMREREKASMYTCVYVCVYGDRELLHLLVKMLVTTDWKHYHCIMQHSEEPYFFWKRKKTSREEPWNNKPHVLLMSAVKYWKIRRKKSLPVWLFRSRKFLIYSLMPPMDTASGLGKL